jgi:hypothetical protein
MSKTVNKDRGNLLTVLIVFSALGVLYYLSKNIFGPHSELPDITQCKENCQQFPVFLPFLYQVLPYWLFAFFIIDIATIYGLWVWKKWAVYAFFITGIVRLVPQFMLISLAQTHMISVNTVGTLFGTIFGSFFGLGIYAFAIGRKWKYFE